MKSAQSPIASPPCLKYRPALPRGARPIKRLITASNAASCSNKMPLIKQRGFWQSLCRKSGIVLPPCDAPKAIRQSRSDAKAQLRELLADKKPYFMCYLYPQERKRYRAYADHANTKCLMEFGISLSELSQKHIRSPEECAFWEEYQRRMPLGTAPLPAQPAVLANGGGI